MTRHFTIDEAVRAMADESRRRARYFEARAGKRPQGKTVPLESAAERARCQRMALAYHGAANRIESTLEER